MVYAFIIHTLNPPAGMAGAGVCRVLYSSTFGTEDMPDDAADQHVSSDEPSAPQQEIDLRTTRKEQLAQVARQVQSEHAFRKSVVIGNQSEQGAGAGPADDAGQFEQGVFRLAAGDPFRVEKVVVWLGLGNAVGFSLVCDKSENRLLAEGVLKLLSRYLQDHAQAVTQPAEVLTKGDRVAIVVHQFLPAGRLLFMNYAVIRQREKDMDNLLRGK